MKVFLLTFGVVFGLGAVASMAIIRHGSQAPEVAAGAGTATYATAPVPAPASAPRSTRDAALDAIPAPTGWNDAAPQTPVEADDQRVARAQNLKAAQTPDASSSDMTAQDKSDVQEMLDAEQNTSHPVNRPK